MSFLEKIIKISQSDYESLANGTPVTNTNNVTLSTIEDNYLYITDSGITADEIPELSWTKITSDLPTTLAGYGITDAASSTHTHTGVYIEQINPSTPNAIVRFGTTGDIQNSIVTIADNGNITINATTSNSPALILKRGTDGDVYTDWQIIDTSGKLSFQSRSNSSTWTERASFADNSGNLTITGTINTYTLAAACAKNTDETTMTSNSTNLPTSKAVAAYITNNAATPTHTHGNITNDGKMSGSTVSGTVTTEHKFLREDGTWQIPAYASIFKASGTNHASGLVPDPGSTTGTTKFLREDASWETAVTSITISAGAGISVNSGAAITTTGTRTISITGMNTSTGDTSLWLNQKGGWSTPPDTKVNISDNISTNGNFPIVFGTTNTTTTTEVNEGLQKNGTKLYFNPSTGTLTAIKLSGELNVSDLTGSIDPHKVFIGPNPSSGSSAAAPTWRVIDNKDLPGEGKITIANKDVVLGDSITLEDMGLANALHFIGVVTDNSQDKPTDGGSQIPTIQDKTYTNAIRTAGDVVLSTDNNEYVWDGLAWRILGYAPSSDYTAEPESGTTNKWISKITHKTDGSIQAWLTSLDTTGTWSGNAATATSWANAQTVYVDLTSAGTNSTLQGGSNSAITLKVNGILKIGNGGTGTNSVNKYGIVYGNSAQNAYTSTATGAAGAILKGGGSSNAPSWYEGLILSGTTASDYEANFKGKISFNSTTNIGNIYTPVYWNDGVPATVYPVQRINFTFDTSHTSSLSFTHDAITLNTQVIKIVVEDGISYLNSSIEWTVANVSSTPTLTLSATTNIPSNQSITGYIMISNIGSALNI